MTTRPRPVLAATGVVLAVTLTGCSTGTVPSGATGASGSGASSDLWDTSAVHAISVDVEDDAYDALVEAYLASGDKEWASATVTIDGTTFEDAGIKLKGNSTLKSVSADSDPATLPWIIRLDKYVDGQSYDGETELVVRGNTSETSLNEAVALDLLGEAGLATEQAVSTRFSMNGSDESLRLVIQNPDEEWDAQNFDASGILYKAEADGDYSYRGDDPDDYADVFDQETGDDDLTPLTDFLKFINDSDDETFAAELGDHLDVDAFATYLAFQDLVDNFDDIDGPGNNSYLRYDEDSGRMTVVSWDLNLAFGSSPAGGGGGGGAAGGGGNGGGGMAGGPGGGPGGGGERPDGAPTDVPTDMPTDVPQGAGGGADGGGAGGGSNVLSERFLANDDFAALVDAATTALTTTLIDSGLAQETLDARATVLKDDASDLVDTATVDSESASVAGYLD